MFANDGDDLSGGSATDLFAGDDPVRCYFGGLHERCPGGLGRPLFWRRPFFGSVLVPGPRWRGGAPIYVGRRRRDARPESNVVCPGAVLRWFRWPAAGARTPSVV